MTQSGFSNRRTKIGNQGRSISLSVFLPSVMAVLIGLVTGPARAGDDSDTPSIGLGTGGLGSGATTRPALDALHEIASARSLGNSRRIALVKQVADGIDVLLPTMRDPAALMDYASQYVTKGIDPDINTMEYWGEDPALQGRVKPAAAAASKMLEQASDLAVAQANVIAKTLHGANDPREEAWVKLDVLNREGKYIDNMMAYYRAIATDTSNGKNKAAVQERTLICDDAIKYIKNEYDMPGGDGGGIQPLVHNRIGKLAMAKGDYVMARAYFHDMASGKTPDGKPIDPAPNLLQVYEARYFSLVCDVLDKKPDAAEKGLADLEAWQKKGLPPKNQDGANVAVEILRYRMLSAKAGMARDEAEKQTLIEQANDTLMALRKAHPEFTPIILSHVLK